MAKKLSVLLDEKRLSALKGCGLDDKIESLFGGQLKAFSVEVSDEKAKKVMDSFDSARVDSRGYITDVPIAFNRVMYEEIAKAKSLGEVVIDNVLKRMAEIKEMAAKESEYLPPPDF